MIPHSRPTLTEEDALAVAAVVRSGQIAQGPQVAAFERAMATRAGRPAAAAVSSGSSALALALRVLGVAAGDEVVIPTYACDALHHAVTRCGATPVLADADPETLSVSLADVKRRLSRLTRCLVVHHAFGLPVDLDRFRAFGVPIVEDCAQAFGVDRAGRPLGAGGDVAVCSFYATKLLTTGEGGMVLGGTDRIAQVIDARDYDDRTDLVPRFNDKLTDMQAALGIRQLGRLDTFIARRRSIARRYRTALADAGCELPPDDPAHVYHRFVIRTREPADRMIAALAERGITARRPVFRPLHRALGRDGFPEADRLSTACVSLPCYPLLTDDDADRVARAVQESLGQGWASRSPSDGRGEST